MGIVGIAPWPTRSRAVNGPSIALRDNLLAAAASCAVASHHEGEWRCTPPRSKEGRAPTSSGVRLTTSKPMSDIPPAPPKSAILIIVLLAVVRSHAGGHRVHLGLLVATPHTAKAAAPAGVPDAGAELVLHPFIVFAGRPPSGRTVTMLIYVQAWLPLVIIALTAAISFAVASLVIGKP